ncbi:MAG: hypothetical protein KY397_04115 [Gemmatimonadetes bacterium]|nr:hypothetical protein [Gemmatimonadota bacterium]
MRTDETGRLVAPVTPDQWPAPFARADRDRVTADVLRNCKGDPAEIEALWNAVEAAHEPDEYGWRVFEHEGHGLSYFLVPNNAGGLTLTLRTDFGRAA